jgi:uncharacterized protein YoxC
VTSWNLFAVLADIQRTVHAVNTKAGQLMSQQDDLTADVQAIAAAVTSLGDAAAAIEAEIAALRAGNPALDLTALDAQVAQLKTAVSAVSAIPAT